MTVERDLRCSRLAQVLSHVRCQKKRAHKLHNATYIGLGGNGNICRAVSMS